MTPQLQPYKTIEKYARIELVEKRSKFIATCAPVATVEEAMDFVGACAANFRTRTIMCMRM